MAKASLPTVITAVVSLLYTAPSVSQACPAGRAWPASAAPWCRQVAHVARERRDPLSCSSRARSKSDHRAFEARMGC